MRAVIVEKLINRAEQALEELQQRMALARPLCQSPAAKGAVMVGIVIVSHSRKVAEGIRELALQMAAPEQLIIAAGGTADGAIGTDACKIKAAIAAANSGDGVLVMVDLGSAVLSAEMAIEMLEGEPRQVKIADAPILEGTIAAAVEASVGQPLSRVAATADGARELRKQ